MKNLLMGLIGILALTACAIVPEPTPQPAPLIATISPAPADTASPDPTVESAPTTEPAPEIPLSVRTFPDATQVEWKMVASGLDQPLDIQHAGDGSGRVFLVERIGKIFILENGVLSDEPFLDISDRLTDNKSEQGLLGLAFHPNYAENGFFFVNYTDLNGNTIIARYQVSENTDQAKITSESVLLHTAQPYGNHNGGGIAFGPDGFLYIGLGDGGSGDDPHGNGQNLNTYLGKLLRIDVDGGETYVIPSDNPFLQGEALPEIWAYGLRNPWRFSFDSLTGDLYIADVGQNLWEEIDFLPAGTKGGANFGWNYMEGLHPFSGEPSAELSLVAPVAEYEHNLGCSVTGGLVYRGDALPEWQGVYLYGDFCTGRIWGLLQVDGLWKEQVLMETDFLIASFGQDEAGNIYLADFATESVFLLKKR